MTDGRTGQKDRSTQDGGTDHNYGSGMLSGWKDIVNFKASVWKQIHSKGQGQGQTILMIDDANLQSPCVKMSIGKYNKLMQFSLKVVAMDIITTITQNNVKFVVIYIT